MAEIKVGTDSIVASMGHISKSVEQVVSGFERAQAVIGGFYDDLILWERASEYWQKKSFAVRVDEIQHLRKLGQISAQEESELWKQLFDEKQYGWRNVKIAEENYHRAMFEHSKKWIDEQTELGKLSASEIAQAWQRVFQSFDDINIKYEAALNIRRALLGEADDDISSRRSDSDRWMRRQDIYDGGDSNRRVEDYTRRIASERELLREIESGFLNGVELGAAEQARRWKEVYEFIQDLEDERYKVAQQYLQLQINDYITASKAAIDEQYEYQLRSYNNELALVRQKYSEMQNLRRSQRRDEELSELVTLRSYYENAVTKEGQDKYKQILSKISDINYEQSVERQQQWLREDEEVLQKKIESLKKEYQDSLAALEQSKNNLVKSSGQVALEGIASATTAGNDISDTLFRINQTFSVQVESMFEKTERYMSEQVLKIAQLFDSIGKYTVGYGASSSSDKNVNVTFNDYGDKKLSNNNAVVSYATEFVGLLQNILRSKGVK